MVTSNPSVLKEDTVDTYYQMLCQNYNNLLLNEKSVMLEYQPHLKKMILTDKSTSLNIDILNTKLLQILDQVSTSKEKDLTPFWTAQSMEISKKLWLPTETDYVDSVLNWSNDSLKKNPTEKSWFSINKIHPQNKNSLMTSFQLSQFSLPESTDCEVTKSKKKSKNQSLKPTIRYKTLKIRIFPNDKEKETIHRSFDQFRWYYNKMITIFYNHYNNEYITKCSKFSNTKLRDLMRKYDYNETDNTLLYNENKNDIPIPSWWSEKKYNLHSRIPRGAVYKFTYSLNSALSNLKNGNINEFKMNYRSKKKSNTYYLMFEDLHYPKYINNIKSHYWFRNKERRRVKISLTDIIKESGTKRGLEMIYDKYSNKYFIHYPIESDWYPSSDRRIDNQGMLKSENGDRIIALDPGIRKFMVGYNPKGEAICIGKGSNKVIINLLLRIDNAISKEMKKGKYKRTKRIDKLYKKMRHLIEEMHWKTINYLMKEYDIILLPDFKISKMVKSRKIGKMTKRLLYMYMFNEFRMKMEYKCKEYNKKLIIVDESYTTQTCGGCGKINKIKGEEVYSCKSCGIKIDRDINAARNILIKNITLR